MNDLILSSQKSFESWRKTSVQDRINFVNNLKNNLLQNSAHYAKVITLEMYKPISQAMAEVQKCAWVCDYYAQNVEAFLTPKHYKIEATESYVTYEPLGVILAVMPWNFPFWQVFRFAIPTILAGNTVVVKHASNVPKSAVLLQQIFEQSGFPKGIYTNLPIKSGEVATVIAHPIIKAVSLTGSEAAGKSVASEAGKHLKKCVLELGGNNASIICQDADIDFVVAKTIPARMQNNGQSCIASKRFIIHSSIVEIFTEKYISAIKKLKRGHPLDFDTDISELARVDLAIDIENQVNQSITMGAQLLCGGHRDENWYEPSVLTAVTPEMPIFREETFGPVVAISTFDTIEDAISLSNLSCFGLGVSIYTQNVSALKPYINDFQEGAVFINEMVKSDPRLPFGGVKSSGYGRELGPEGMMEFVNVKTVVIT